MDPEIAHGIVSSRFPEFACEEPSYLGRGWDNFCIEYPNGIVFRLPMRKAGAGILRNEILALPVVRIATGNLQIPEFLYVGEPSSSYRYPFVGYPKIKGQTADRIEWTHEDRLRAATGLGGFLKALHRVDVGHDSLRRLPRDNPFKQDPKQILEKLRTRLAPIRTGLGTLSPAMVLALGAGERAAALPLRPYEDCVLHGDLYPRHVLADQRQVTGVIDWGDVLVGDPAVDLSIAYTFFEPDERPAFWEAYGRPEDDFNQPLMVVRAAMYGFALLAYGLDEADDACVRMGEQILSRMA